MAAAWGALEAAGSAGPWEGLAAVARAAGSDWARALALALAKALVQGPASAGLSAAASAMQ